MSGLESLLRVAPFGAEATLQAFALAESLTDRTAEKIYAIVPLECLSFADFASALQYSDIVEPRNSEWNLVPSARNVLIGGSRLSPGQAKSVHRTLLDQALSTDRGRPGVDTPSYLFTHAGLAYHHAAVGEIEASLRHYSRAAMGPYNGAQWLASEFAADQERRKVIPSGTIEATFLRAMVLFRTGRRREALPLLRRVAESDQARPEVAIALHIVANDQARRRESGAEASYKRSIAIRREIDDDWGLAHTEHSYANFLTRSGRYSDAEPMYKRSIETLRELPDPAGVAQTEHSLANMYTRARQFDDAESAYGRSIEIDRKSNDLMSAAQTEHSLANMYVKAGRLDDAEAVFERNIALREEIADQLGLAETLHSLANLYARSGHYSDAAAAYERSLGLGERLKNTRHLAMVLHSYAKLFERSEPGKALEMLQRSLALDDANGNRRGMDMVSRSIAALRKKAGI